MRRSLAGIETKPPQTRWSLTGDHFSSPFCRHGLYFLYFDDGEDAALLSGIVIANHLDGLISDDKNILHSAVSPSTRGLCALSKSTALECCEGWSDFQVLCRRHKVRIKIYVYSYSSADKEYVQVFPEILPEMQPKLPEKRRQPKRHEKVPGRRNF